MSSSTPPPDGHRPDEEPGGSGHPPRYPDQGGSPAPGGYGGAQPDQAGGYGDPTAGGTYGGSYQGADQGYRSQGGGYGGGQGGGYGSGQGGAPYGPPYAGGPQYGQPPYGQSPRNGMGIAALVVAILSLLVAWIPFIGLVAVVGGIVGIVLGVVALGRVRRGEATNKGMSVAGIVISVIAILLAIAATVFGSYLFSQVAPELFGPEFQQCVETYGDDPEALDRCLQDVGLLEEYQDQQG